MVNSGYGGRNLSRGLSGDASHKSSTNGLSGASGRTELVERRNEADLAPAQRMVDFVNKKNSGDTPPISTCSGITRLSLAFLDAGVYYEPFA